jgi:UDP-glucose 4-epimerase
VTVARSPHETRPAWLARLSGAGVRRISVVGGSGRLGSRLVRYLVAAGCEVCVLDTQPPEPLPGVDFIAYDLGDRRPVPDRALWDADGVVHLAAVHGAHLAAGLARREFWKINVNGSQKVIEAAAASGARRLVLASSTSVYGPGTPQGYPARVLDELTPLRPDDVYDFTKIAAEHLLADGVADGVGVALRLGRFFFPSQAGYQLRKLSTGLDVRDACQAMVLALTASQVSSSRYCIASDLPLSLAQRKRLGLSAGEVLEEVLPGFGALAAARGIDVPARVGKSVSSARARDELGYAPERSLDRLAAIWGGAGSTAMHSVGVVPD